VSDTYCEGDIRQKILPSLSRLKQDWQKSFILWVKEMGPND
jgi:hypothetical protein